MTEYTIDYIKKNNLILLEVISGSHAYGLNTEDSDIDKRGIFVQKPDDYLGLKNIEQISDEKNDIVYYEIKRFLQLALQGNPNILELIVPSEEHILYKHPLFDLLKPEYFLSKQCRNTFGGYAIAQIKKARGLNKKIVNPVEKERKTPLDFCYAIDKSGYKTIPLIKYLNINKLKQECCGLVNVPHMKDVYALFYDYKQHYVESGSHNEEEKGFKGIIQSEKSNDISLSSVPENITPECIISYNKDGYSSYCKDYKEYWDWVEKRNPHRYKQNISHNQNCDFKNLMHCFRLLQMAKEIAKGEGIIVKRPNRDFLLEIRNGELKYDDLVNNAEKRIEELDELFKKSDLPKKPKVNKVNELLIKIRKEFNN